MKMESIECHKLQVPDAHQVVDALSAGLQQHYKKADVKVVECPDLVEEPFNLAASGLCGNPTILHLGGEHNLFPNPNFSKIYDFKSVTAKSESPQGLVIGASAGPHARIGHCSEHVVNAAKFGSDHEVNKSMYSFITDNEGKHHTAEKSKWIECSFLANALCSEGSRGQVIQVDVAQPLSSEPDYLDHILQTMEKSFKGVAVGIGGVFVLKSGTCKNHIMSKKFESNLDTPEKIRDWLCFFDFQSPYVAVGTIISNPPAEWNARKIHFHGSNLRTNETGHFHHELPPSESGDDYATITGYFVLAERIVIVDKKHVG